MDLTKTLLSLEAGSLDLLRILCNDGWKMPLRRSVIQASGEVAELVGSRLAIASNRQGIRVVNHEPTRAAIQEFLQQQKEVFM